MVIKTGRYGRFLGCSGYPECRTILSLVAGKGLCPECGGDLVEKRSRRGASFYGCANYPNCSFASWDPPTGELCPKCGKAMFAKKGQKAYCGNKDCENAKKTRGKTK
jgi:DNA topoisomerase-1